MYTLLYMFMSVFFGFCLVPVGGSTGVGLLPVRRVVGDTNFLGFRDVGGLGGLGFRD